MQLKNSYICIAVENDNGVMGQKEKLIERFKQRPKDFTWDELVRLFATFGYTIGNKGKTSGSRVIFTKAGSVYTLHKPHPGKVIKNYVLKQVYEFFEKNGWL